MTEKRNMTAASSEQAKPGPVIYHQRQGVCLKGKRTTDACAGESQNCFVCSFGLNDIEALAKIKRILAKGNNAEVKRGKTGITVMEVHKTIIE